MIQAKKIILAPSGSDGDIFPMLEFAKKLRERNHEIIFCTLLFARPLIESNGFLFIEAGLDVKKWTKDKNFMQKNFRLYNQEIDFLKADIEFQFRVLKEASKGADYIFSGGYNYAASSIAQVYQMKHVHIFHVPNVYPTADHPCMMVPWLNMPKWLNILSWKINSILQNYYFKALINCERKKIKLPPIKDVWDYYIGESILAVDKSLHQIPLDYKNKNLQTNYWSPKVDGDLGRELLDFIREGEKPFYFGFGSMPCSNKLEIIQIVETICKKYKSRAIISKGWAGLNAKNSKDIFFVEKIPHDKLFPLLDLVVHHGGPGTVDTACRSGNVQIIVPHILDQFFWGDRLNKLGVTPKMIERKKFNLKSFDRAYKASYKNPQMKASAIQLATKINGHDGFKDFFAEDLLDSLGVFL